MTSEDGSKRRSTIIVRRGLKRVTGVYQKAKIKLKRTPSDTDSVAPESDSESEASESVM